MIKLSEKTILEAIRNNDMVKVEALVNEAIQVSNFSTTDKKRYNAFKSIAKKFKKSSVRPSLAGAFTNKDNNLTVCDGYIVITINKESLENCDMIENDVEKVNTDRFFNDSESDFLELNTNDVLGFLKLSKSRKEKKAIYDHEKISFDAELFKMINDCLDLTADDTKIKYTNDISPLFFENKNGKALLMPIRKNS